EELKLVAIKHALRNGEFCVREDGSVCQSASFDSDSGELLKTYTHKGFSESSAWARAQAWAMMGYSYLSSKFPENEDLYTLAESTCRWWVDNVPDDLISAWDFDAPNSSDTKKDTSATAIAAYAMLKLSSIHKDRIAARKYYRIAHATVWNLCEGYLTPVDDGDQRPVGILTAGCFDPNRDTAVDNELIWGDYFLFKSLGVLTGILPINKPS
ncbi:glycoside hydrolase family 88 protein, partial [Chromohalobacter japonicus]|uniref:glycoside hydrolase family 88 protein n=1 Tax=Chromohalobacter japonicus TaxID=223900 RepID=UPI001FF350F0